MIVEWLFEVVIKVGVGVFLVIVYNILWVFCDVGLLCEIMVDGLCSYFDINMMDYLYFYWEDDGCLIDVLV